MKLTSLILAGVLVATASSKLCRPDQCCRELGLQLANAGVAADTDGLVMLIQPVVLSGGSGTRLWPLSREKYPKHCCR
jgi:hypothetical protein